MFHVKHLEMKKPSWLKRRLPVGPAYESVKSLVKKTNLHTVCQEAQCPNIFECFSQKTATFLILGDRCTRNCRFCAVDNISNTQKEMIPPDKTESIRVADAVKNLELTYVVVTSVTRDDLPDGGAWAFVETINQIKKKDPLIRVEVLIPDFLGNDAALDSVIEAKPDVINHNIETVKRLYDDVRPQAVYQRSLNLLKRVYESESEIPAKSGIMLGLGENDNEINETLHDLFNHGVRLLTIGQYLQPSKLHLPVKEYVLPEKFDEWRQIALNIGFTKVASGPFARSSYHAKTMSDYC